MSISILEAFFFLNVALNTPSSFSYASETLDVKKKEELKQKKSSTTTEKVNKITIDHNNSTQYKKKPHHNNRPYSTFPFFENKIFNSHCNFRPSSPTSSKQDETSHKRPINGNLPMKRNHYDERKCANSEVAKHPEEKKFGSTTCFSRYVFDRPSKPSRLELRSSNEKFHNITDYMIADYIDWEGFYEIMDLTPLNGGQLRLRNLMIIDTGSEFGLIASIFDEELNSINFRNLVYSTPEDFLASEESLGYSFQGRLEIKRELGTGKISGSLTLPETSSLYQFSGNLKRQPPANSTDPCSFSELIGVYKGQVGEIPGNLNIEMTEFDQVSVVFSSYDHSNLATRMNAHYFPSTGRLFMVNQDSNYPFVWRLIATKSGLNRCEIGGIAYSSYHSSVYSAQFLRHLE